MRLKISTITLYLMHLEQLSFHKELNLEPRSASRGLNNFNCYKSQKRSVLVKTAHINKSSKNLHKNP